MMALPIHGAWKSLRRKMAGSPQYTLRDPRVELSRQSASTLSREEKDSILDAYAQAEKGKAGRKKEMKERAERFLKGDEAALDEGEGEKAKPGVEVGMSGIAETEEVAVERGSDGPGEEDKGKGSEEDKGIGIEEGKGKGSEKGKQEKEKEMKPGNDGGKRKEEEAERRGYEKWKEEEAEKRGYERAKEEHRLEREGGK